MTPSIWQLLIVFFIWGGGIATPIILALLFIKKKEYSQLSGNQKYAGFWYRVFAGIIDLVIIAGGSFVFGLVVGIVSIIISENVYMFFADENNLFWEIYGWIGTFLYYVLFQSSSKQATPGMMLLKIKIYDEQFQRVGFWRLSVRYFSTILSTIILLIGFFMIGWTKRKQGLHDLIARTIHLKE